MKVIVSISGRLYDLAAVSLCEIELPAGATVDDALKALHWDVGGSQCLVPSALIAVSGQHLGTVACHSPQPLAEADDLFIFAPVAGG